MNLRDIIQAVQDSDLFYWVKTLAFLAFFILICTGIYQSCHPEVLVPGQINLTPICTDTTECMKLKQENDSLRNLIELYGINPKR